MNILDKVFVIHKLIMGEVSAAMVFTAGVINSGWEKGDHIQHTSDSLEGHIRLFSRQVDKITNDIENDNFDEEKVQKYLNAFMEDKQKLQFNIVNDRIDKELFQPLQEHINSLNDIIGALKYLLIAR